MQETPFVPPQVPPVVPPAVRDATLAELDACAAIACDSEIGRRYSFERATLAARMREALADGAIILVATVGSDPIENAGAQASGSGTGRGSGRGSGSAVERGAILGFAWIMPKGAFGASPYLKLIAVDGSRRSSGVGAALLAAYEDRTAAMGRMWTLLVSDFNVKACAFYEKYGYRKAGELPGFAREGFTEYLMVKTRT
jgi:ribosomal protein S18 acetylase RimI-like enzyme